MQSTNVLYFSSTKIYLHTCPYIMNYGLPDCNHNPHIHCHHCLNLTLWLPERRLYWIRPASQTMVCCLSCLYNSCCLLTLSVKNRSVTRQVNYPFIVITYKRTTIEQKMQTWKIKKR